MIIFHPITAAKKKNPNIRKPGTGPNITSMFAASAAKGKVKPKKVSFLFVVNLLIIYNKLLVITKFKTIIVSTDTTNKICWFLTLVGLLKKIEHLEFTVREILLS